MGNSEVGIFKIGDRAFLRIQQESIEIQNYEILYCAQNGMEIKVTIAFQDETTEFSSTTKKESLKRLNL